MAVLKNDKKPAWPPELPDAETPIFITWKKDGDLRGCIGTFSADRVSKLIPEYSITSAMKDPRFDPVAIEEVPSLTVHVSLLVNFTEQPDIYQWEIGKHGIIIKSVYKGKHYSGTFLPEVASEQKWTKEETLSHLIRKAGFFGKLEEIASSIKLTTYESSKERMTYAEYQKYEL